MCKVPGSIDLVYACESIIASRTHPLPLWKHILFDAVAVYSIVLSAPLLFCQSKTFQLVKTVVSYVVELLQSYHEHASTLLFSVIQLPIISPTPAFNWLIYDRWCLFLINTKPFLCSFPIAKELLHDLLGLIFNIQQLYQVFIQHKEAGAIWQKNLPKPKTH